MRLAKKIRLFGLPAVLLIGVAVLGVLFLKQRETIAAQQRMIEAQTESAYHALSDDLNDLNVTLQKLEAAGTPARLSKSFSDIRRLSAGAVRALTLLPGALTIEAVTLALIPKCNTREVLCYECKCTKGETFFSRVHQRADRRRGGDL